MVTLMSTTGEIELVNRQTLQYFGKPFEELKDPKQLTIFSRLLLSKLEALNEPMLKEHLGKYLTQYQINGILKRRNAILALSKKLVAEKGEGAVLYQ